MRMLTEKAVPVGLKRAAAVAALLLLTAIMQIALSDGGAGDLKVLGLKLHTFVPHAFATVCVARLEDGDGSGGGGGDRRGTMWYSYGSVRETRWCTTYEQVEVLFPYPHYETKQVYKQVEVWYLLERCNSGGDIRECTPGTERKTYQGSTC